MWPGDGSPLRLMRCVIGVNRPATDWRPQLDVYSVLLLLAMVAAAAALSFGGFLAARPAPLVTMTAGAAAVWLSRPRHLGTDPKA